MEPPAAGAALPNMLDCWVLGAVVAPKEKEADGAGCSVAVLPPNEKDVDAGWAPPTPKVKDEGVEAEPLLGAKGLLIAALSPPAEKVKEVVAPPPVPKMDPVWLAGSDTAGICALPKVNDGVAVGAELFRLPKMEPDWEASGWLAPFPNRTGLEASVGAAPNRGLALSGWLEAVPNMDLGVSA